MRLIIDILPILGRIANILGTLPNGKKFLKKSKSTFCILDVEPLLKPNQLNQSMKYPKDAEYLVILKTMI